MGTDSEALRQEIASIREFNGVSGYNMAFNESKEMIKGIYVYEKGRKDEERTDQEQARAHKRYDGLGNAVLARVHLYVNLESGHNHTNPGDGTTESLDVKHHCYHVVVHRRQRIRTPTVIHAAAFRQS